jgi:hypothetical protein
MPREEEGICIATGLELAGSRTVLIFQDNGIGNLLTALLTLPVAFPDSAIVLTLGGTAREMLAVAGRKANHIISPRRDGPDSFPSIGTCAWPGGGAAEREARGDRG